MDFAMALCPGLFKASTWNRQVPCHNFLSFQVLFSFMLFIPYGSKVVILQYSTRDIKIYKVKCFKLQHSQKKIQKEVSDYP